MVANVISIDLIFWCRASIIMSLTLAIVKTGLSLIDRRVELRSCDRQRGIQLAGEAVLHDWRTNLSSVDSWRRLSPRRGSFPFILTVTVVDGPYGENDR